LLEKASAGFPLSLAANAFINMIPTPPTENRLTQWLDKIQQESWQLELLISGFALSLLLSMEDSIQKIAQFGVEVRGLLTTSNFFGFCSLFLVISWVILIINLSIHVILRTFWVSAIGLRNISSAIQIEELQMSPRFEHFLKQKMFKFDHFIERLETICCLIFAYTFILVSAMFSIGMFFIVQSLFMGIMKEMLECFYGKSFKLEVLPTWYKFLIRTINITYGILGFLYLLDFVSLGKLKRWKRIQAYYFPVYRFFGVVTQARFFRPLYYNMIDHPIGRKIMFAIIPYIAALLLFESSGINNSALYSTEQHKYHLEAKYYDALRPEKMTISGLSLQDKYCPESDFLELFLPDHNLLGNQIKMSCLDSIPDKNEIGLIWFQDFQLGAKASRAKSDLPLNDSLFRAQEAKNLQKIQCAQSHYRLYVNDSLLSKLSFSFYQHPKTQQLGLSTILDAKPLTRGKHYLRLDIMGDSLKVKQRFVVPFWKS
jgi:hypothetical protein